MFMFICQYSQKKKKIYKVLELGELGYLRNPSASTLEIK